VLTDVFATRAVALLVARLIWFAVAATTMGVLPPSCGGPSVRRSARCPAGGSGCHGPTSGPGGNLLRSTQGTATPSAP
jgi:hypothetical protein